MNGELNASTRLTIFFNDVQTARIQHVYGLPYPNGLMCYIGATSPVLDLYRIAGLLCPPYALGYGLGLFEELKPLRLGGRSPGLGIVTARSNV